eukprot:Skav220795  [mRNA]  locus=scaffold150:105276:106870:- [translate_table: standard]
MVSCWELMAHRPMSFAQALAKKADEFEARKKAEQQRLDAEDAQRIRDWAAEAIEALKNKCTQASEAGKYEVSQPTLGILQTPRPNNAALPKQELQNRFRILGFSSFEMTKRTFPGGRLLPSGGIDYLVKASWKDVSRSASAEPPKKRLKGHVRTCQVCEEKKSIVVLAPCGHVLCEDCREQQTKQNNQNCPFCRQHVICVTDGLFFS